VRAAEQKTISLPAGPRVAGRLRFRDQKHQQQKRKKKPEGSTPSSSRKNPQN
jgi:hypothetical protein